MFCSVEDVVQDILVNSWTRIPEDMRIDAHKTHEIFAELATLEHFEGLTRLMETYPSNAQIKTIGCALLLKMYDYRVDLDDFDGFGAAMQHARWAIDSASMDTWSYELMCTNLRLLVCICELYPLVSEGDGDSIHRDLISLVFAFQHKWHLDSDIMFFCHQLCDLELADWTMPVPLPGSSTPAPVDIITAYMDRHSDDNDYQCWGWEQLRDLVVKNAAAVVVTQECMSRIARLIRVQHAGILSKTTHPTNDSDQLYRQQENMCIFLNVIVRLSDAAYRHFVGECDVPLLLKSLDNILVLRDVAHNTPQPSYEVEIGEICCLLLYICEKDGVNVASFFANEGFDILAHALNYSVCEDSPLKKPSAYSTVCLRLMHSIFARKNFNAMACVTTTQKNGTRTQKRFSFRFRHFGNRLQTFPAYLVQTLCRYETMLASNMDEYTHQDIQYIVRLLRILVLESNEEDILTPSQIQMTIVAMEQILLKVVKSQLEARPEDRLQNMDSLYNAVDHFDDVVEIALGRKQTRTKQVAVSMFQRYVLVSNQFRPEKYDIDKFLRSVAP